MRTLSRHRSTWLTGIAIGVVLGLFGAQVLASIARGDDDLPVYPMYGVGAFPPVDGNADDALTRFDVAVDGVDLADLQAADARVLDLHAVGAGRWLLVTDQLSLDEVRSLPGVADAAEEVLARPTADDEFLSRQWGLRNVGATYGAIRGVDGVDIGFDEASTMATGDGIVVAVVDSGIQTDHPDLAGQFWTNDAEVCDNGVDDDRNGYVDDCQGWDFVHGDNTPYDAGSDNRHGTHVAGTIAAHTGNGVGVAALAPGVTIMPLKVFDGGSSPATRIAEAIHYAVDNGADIVNLSLGGPGPSPAQTLAVEHALDNGVLLVVAAGNDGVDIDLYPSYPASFPHPNILSVGSHSADGNISSFSNRGAVGVDLYAPGEMIAATVPGSAYAYLSGTSMAAPMATAAAALVAEAEGTTDAQAIREVLTNGVVPAAVYEPVSAWGGRVFAPMALGDPIAVAGELQATFAGLHDLDPGEVTTLVTASLPNAVENDAEVELFLARWHAGALHAVLDHPVEVAVDGVAHWSTTDSQGAVGVGLLTPEARQELQDGTLELELTSTLPTGRYALVLAAHVTNGKILDPSAAFFDVGDPVPAPEDPAAPIPSPTDAPDPGVLLPVPTDPIDPNDPEPTVPNPGTILLPVPGAPLPDGDGGTAPSPGISLPGPDQDGGAPAPTEPAPTPGISLPGPGTSPSPSPTEPAPTPGIVLPPTIDPIAPTEPAPGPTEPAPSPGILLPPPGEPLPDQPAPEYPDLLPPGGTGGDDGDGGTDDGVRAAVWPSQGPTSGGTLVNIRGEFDPTDDLYVMIGDDHYRPSLISSWLLVLVTRPSAPAVGLDVTVHRAGGEVVASHPAAFSFVAVSSCLPDLRTGQLVCDSPTPPPGSSTPPPGGEPAPAPGDGGGSVPPPGSSDPVPVPAPDGGDDGGDGEPTPDPTPDPTPEPTRPPFGAPHLQDNTAGRPFTLPDGMTLDRFVRGPFMVISESWWDTHGCDGPVCQGVPIRR